MELAHHALLVRDNGKINVSDFTEAEEILDFSFSKLGIDDTRDLIARAYTTASGESKKVLVIRTDFITLEAQSSLLKVLEEPPVSTRFIFIVPRDLIVLDTLQSRLAEAKVEFKQEDAFNEFKDFFKSNLSARLNIIDESIKTKNVEWQRAIKRGLIDYLNQSNLQKRSIKELEYISRTLLTRGASNKMLLEHLALTLGTR